jgi:hypothetical protein
MIVIISFTKWIEITLGVLIKHVSPKYFTKQEWSFRLFHCIQRAVEGTEGRRGDRGP